MFSLRDRYSHWKYKNTFLLFFSILILLSTVETAPAQSFIVWLETFGYIGAFVTGIFFVSTFTVTPAIVVLYHFALQYNPFLLALCAGFGAMLGDYLVFRFFKDQVFHELRPLFARLQGSYLERLFNTPYFAWLLPVIGAAIIASPLPDEIGVGFLGISKLKPWQFVVISFVLNTSGIFLLVAMAKTLP